MSKGERIERLRMISSAGFRGGYARIFSYVTSEVARNEQAVREAEARLRMQINRLNVLGGTSEKEKEGEGEKEKEKGVGEEIRLDEIAFTFGFVSRTVHVDVLGGIKVPLELAIGKKKRELEEDREDNMKRAKLE